MPNLLLPWHSNAPDRAAIDNRYTTPSRLGSTPSAAPRFEGNVTTLTRPFMNLALPTHLALPPRLTAVPRCSHRPLVSSWHLQRLARLPANIVLSLVGTLVLYCSSFLHAAHTYIFFNWN